MSAFESRLYRRLFTAQIVALFGTGLASPGPSSPSPGRRRSRRHCHAAPPSEAQDGDATAVAQPASIAL
jgi:hypothetical protein